MLRCAHIRGNELSVFKQITLRFFKARPHESENFWNRRFFSVFAFSPRVNGVYRCKTGGFSKTVPRVEIFENDGFNKFTYGRTKTEAFEYYDVIHHIPLALRMLSYFHHFSAFLWTDENDSNTLRVNGYFLKMEKKYSFSKYPDTFWQGLSSVL